MKKLLLAAVAVMMTALSVNAQVKVSSPHPDLDIQIKRCAYASGTVVIDMIITNFGPDIELSFPGSGAGYTNITTAFDDEGNQYTSRNSKISLGLTSQGLGSSNGEDCYLPQDVPMKFRVQVEKVSSQASRFPMLKFGVDTETSGAAMNLDGRKDAVIIRNLEWAK